MDWLSTRMPKNVFDSSYWALMSRQATNSPAVPLPDWMSIPNLPANHGIFEGRAPALLDNLVQAILLAPLFVWLEVLFAFGYRPELKSRLDESVEKEIEKFHASKSSEQKTGSNGDVNGHAK